MRGLVLAGVRDVEYRTDLPEPAIEAPGDALVRVELAGLCGSDLHPYEGRERVRFGVVAGHEAVGEVVAVGAGVAGVRPGDRVLVPFTTSCGACPECRRGLSARCRHGALFGYGPPDDPGGPALQGAQAELLRVPLAAGTLVAVPDGVTVEQALLLADNLPTGWYAAERAAIPAGGALAVVGLGAVGLCAVAAAPALGAGAVVGIDPVPGRRRLAERLGAVTADPGELAGLPPCDLAQVGLPPGGAASVVEAASTPEAQRLAASLLRPGGTLSIIAVQTEERFALAPAEVYDRNLTVRSGRAPVRSLLQRLLGRVERHELDVPAGLVLTHPRVPLADGPETYRRFAAREAGMVKVAFAAGTGSGRP